MTKYFTRTKRLMSVGLALALGIGGCAAPTVEPTGFTIGLTGDTQTPPYSRVPYQPFTREAAVQIAYREWRAFGQPVVLPHTELAVDNERAEGLWQRVGDYWWLGLPLGSREQDFTGIHDQTAASLRGRRMEISPGPRRSSIKSCGWPVRAAAFLICRAIPITSMPPGKDLDGWLRLYHPKATRHRWRSDLLFPGPGPCAMPSCRLDAFRVIATWSSRCGLAYWT
jgi:hypothetical protein